jgi:hypothetical protein
VLLILLIAPLLVVFFLATLVGNRKHTITRADTESK